MLKLRTVRAPATLAVTALAVTVALTLQPILRAGLQGAPSLGTESMLRALLSAQANGPLLVLILGVLQVTTEHRFGTLSGTLLQSPHRRRLMAAKATVAVIAAAMVGLASLTVIALIGAGAGAFRGALWDSHVVVGVVGQMFAYPLYAVLGIGTGALLIRSQPIAVLLPIAWFLLVESYLGSLAKPLARWLPANLTASLAGRGDAADLAPAWAGAAGLLGYALLLAAAGTRRTTHADVT